MTHNTDLTRASIEAHLAILRQRHEALNRDDVRFVHWAFDRGFTVYEIATRIGIDILHVQRILAMPPSV